MIFVALLRGINISGKNKIDMKELKKEDPNLIYIFQVVYYIFNKNNKIKKERHKLLLFGAGDRT